MNINAFIDVELNELKEKKPFWINEVWDNEEEKSIIQY